jgi:hypothetical protein
MFRLFAFIALSLSVLLGSSLQEFPLSAVVRLRRCVVDRGD